jgi:hypothetical protein
MLDEYIKQAPLNNVNERVNAISLLLSGNPLSNLRNVLSQLPEDHIWDKNLFQEALRAFVLNYCSSMVRQEQKRFMKRHLGLPSGQMTTTLLSRTQQFNQYLPYLPGTGNKFDADDIREMVYNALPTYVHTIIATSDYKWYNKNKLNAEVCAYFDCLLVISALARKARNGNLSPPLRNKLLTPVRKIRLIKSFKHESSSQNKTKCVQCHFCNMKSHEEDTCCFKLKAM